MNDTIQFMPVLPEIIIASMACFILVIDLYLKDSQKMISFGLTILTLIVGLVFIVSGYGQEPQLIFNGTVVVDLLSVVTKFGIVLASLLLLIYSQQYALDRKLFGGEYFVLVLLGTVGMMVLTSSSHMLTLYMGLELLSLCMYALIAMQRDSAKASEAAMKYFVLGALASGILLYGMSLFYGLTGSLQLGEISQSLASQDKQSMPLILATIFIVVGLAFKLGAVPFHMWVPDVYHGSPTSATIFIGAAPKIAAFAMVVRLLVSGFSELQIHWGDMLSLLAIASVAVGNILAIAQTNFKRMLAYSTISHMGFFLFGIVSGNEHGYGAALFYVMVYAFMSLGAFGLLMILSSKGVEVEEIEDLKGLNQTHPWLAFLMLLVMFSMAGVPPTIGFYAKLSVIQSLVSVGYYQMAIIAVLLAVIGAYYYLRIIKTVYFEDADQKRILTPQPVATFVLSTNILAVLWLMPFVGVLIDICQKAVMVLP